MLLKIYLETITGLKIVGGANIFIYIWQMKWLFKYFQAQGHFT